MAAAGDAVAQDIHFSQPDINPILYNPAYSGFFDGSGRFALTYRNQWAAVAQPFQTMAASAEYAVMRRRYERDGISAGLTVFNDRAGTLRYGTTAASLIMSYYKSLNRFNNNFLSFGLSGCFAQSGYDAADADLLDRTEVLQNAGKNYLLIGIGAAWYYHPHDFLEIKIAASGNNLNRPNISYTAVGETDECKGYVEPRFNLYSRIDYRFGGYWSIEPLLALQLQRNNSELVAGADFKWHLSEFTDNNLTLSAGVASRIGDALLFSLSTEWTTMLVAFTYDHTISDLREASLGVGAFEVSVVYRLSKKELYQRKALPCPII